MSPAAFSPLRRRGFLQARARVEVSWTYARVHEEVRMYLKQPQVESGSRCACEAGMRARPKDIKGAKVRSSFGSEQPSESGRFLQLSGHVVL
jgi:hypothetical protein